MENIIKFFIKYPIWTSVIKILVIAFGILALTNLPSSFFPERESQIINISLIYPGASPEEIEKGVIQKIEDNLKGVQGVERFSSVSRENSGSIVIDVLSDYDADEVLLDVKNAVDRINSFPLGLEPPVVATRPEVELAFSFALSGDVDLKSLKTMARNVEDDLRETGGITQVSLSGFPEEEIVIYLQEKKLRAFNLTFDEVSRAIRNYNQDVSSGSIKTADEELLIRLEGKKYFAEELEDVVIRATPDGSKVRVRDIAIIENTWAELPQRSYVNDTSSVIVSVNKIQGENILDVTQKCRDYVAEFNKKNKKIKATVINDISISLRDRINMLVSNGVIGAILVLLSLSMFLNWRLAFWVAFSIPFSFFGMFGMMYLFGITINLISLFGCIVVVGIVVDDGIVVAEQIYQNYENGYTPYKAAIGGTSQMLSSIFYSIITTIVAFLPFFFLDTPGPRISDMSFVVIFVLVFSLIEASFILPSHLSHSKALSRKDEPGKIRKAFDKCISVPRDKLYGPLLKIFMKYKYLPIVIGIFVIMVTMGGFEGNIIKTTAFPSIDAESFVISIEMPSGTREIQTEEVLKRIEKAVWTVNDSIVESRNLDSNVVVKIVRNVASSAMAFGNAEPGGTNIGNLQVFLVNDKVRQMRSLEFATLVQQKTGPLYEANKAEFGSTSFFGKPISITLVGRDINELQLAKEDIKSQLRGRDDLRDIADNDPQGLREIKIKLKEKANLLGLTQVDIARQIRQGFFGDEIQRIQRGPDEIKVWAKYDYDFRSSLKNWEEMRYKLPNGVEYPLNELIDYEIKRGSIKINHIDGKREITIDAEMKNPLGQVTKTMSEVAETIVKPTLASYPSIKTAETGQQRRLSKLASGRIYIMIAFFIMFFFIALSFRSFLQAIAVIILIPLAIMGGIWGHVLHNIMVSIMSFYGFIALMGIVVNDSIVFINEINHQLRNGHKFYWSVFNAGITRFRPILLTTLTTVLGLLPLILETSVQAQFLIPMAISVSYGLLFGSLFILLLLPILMILLNHIRRGWVWIFTGEMPTPEEVEPANKERKLIAEYLGDEEAAKLI